MSLRTFLKPFSFLPALLLMYLIYSFSAQEGADSSALSYKVSYYMVKTADQILDADLEESEIENFATRFHGVTRKLAHMTEYFALAVAVSFPLYVYGLHGFPLMLAAGMICVAFACGDEYHQSFVAGRSPSKRDVFIDSFGIFWGIILVRIIGWTGRKTIFRPLRRKKRDAAQPQSGYPDGRPVSYYTSDPRGPAGEYRWERRTSPSDAPRGYAPEYQYRQDYLSRTSGCYDSGNVEYMRGSDKLSEDLSLKKLAHDIRDQLQQEKKQPGK